MSRSKSTAVTSRNPDFSKKEAIYFGFEVAKKNIFYFLTIFVIAILVNRLLTVLHNSFAEKNGGLLSLLFSLLSIIIGMVISMGFIKISLKFVDERKSQISDIFYTKSIFNYFLASVIKSIVVFVGFLLLIVPGIIFSIKLQFVPYLIVDKGIGVVEALKKSWEMTKGVKWNLLLFGLLLGVINILGVLCLLVGLLITVPLTMVATAYVYRKLLIQTAFK